MRTLAALISMMLCVGLISEADAAVYNKPIYDPHSKSYFELIPVTREVSPDKAIPELPFDKSVLVAAGRVFKGVRGRLATVKSQATHELIMQTLRPDMDTWIGLRYFCNTRELKWIDGESLKRGDFQAWHQQWDQGGNASCTKGRGEANWMPVAYTPVSAGFRWIAKGAFKHYRAILVEYPVGHE